jgi:PAS domain S-box-containing protein
METMFTMTGAALEAEKARLVRVRHLARLVWVLVLLVCLLLVGIITLAVLDDPLLSRSSITLLLLGGLMVSLLLFATRLYVRHTVRLAVQAAVIERQNADLRAAGQSLRHEMDERAVAESQRDNFFNLSADLLAILDSDGRFLRVNPAFAEMVGRSATELVGIDITAYLQSEDANLFRHILAEVDEQETAATLEARCHTVSGENWFLWTLVKRGVHIYAVAHDFSAHRAAADALKAAKESAEQANETKTQFLANMSHELRTPLNAVIGFSQTLALGLHGPLTPKQLEYVTDIGRAGEHLLGIVSELLDLSVIDSGAMVLSEHLFAPADVVADAIALIRPKAEAADIVLETDIPSGLPQLRADRGKIRQILVNFLSNAVKFTPAGRRISLSAALTPAGEMIFSIKDEGIGINPADIAQVLSPFGKTKSAYARSHGGVGLGLPLARRLAELHGGAISLESAPGAGTLACLSLPAGRVERA